MKTSITETFRDGTVLVTGSTGFLGKLLIDKLLRTCSLNTIAILVRSKHGCNSYERITDIYKQSVSINYNILANNLTKIIKLKTYIDINIII